MKKTRMMHTWTFGSDTQYVWMEGSTVEGFAELVKTEWRGYVVTNIATGFMREEPVFSQGKRTSVQSTVIAAKGEGLPVVYGEVEVKKSRKRA
jgi:hypothetical protein